MGARRASEAQQILQNPIQNRTVAETNFFRSVPAPPPFRRFRGSDPLLPAELHSVAHRVSPCSAPPAVRSGCRCDRGSDPAVPELATEGLTHCRAPLRESPALHRSDCRPLSTCPAQKRPAASFPPPHGIGENASICHLDD